MVIYLGTKGSIYADDTVRTSNEMMMMGVAWRCSLPSKTVTRQK